MSAIRKAVAPVFGRYHPIALLGEGSLARVYLTVSRSTVGWGNLVVIKEIKAELASQPQFKEMFLHEARMALGLHHPNIVQIYEVFEERAPYVLAMEFLDGQTMANLLKRVGRVEMLLPLHLWMLTQVLAGLHHAHEVHDREGKPLQIVHRDVCPSNVFVTYDGQVKLVDFGIAKLAEIAGAMLAHHPDTTAAGKLGYGAPEQFLSQPIDPRSDVYSVGVMMWEAVARRRRRVANNPAEIIDARIAGVEPSIADVVPDVPPALAEICDRATAVDRGERYQSAREFQLALDAYLDGCWEPADRRQMSELMDRTFALERASMRRCLERRLGRSGPVTGLTPVPRSPLGLGRAALLGFWRRSYRAVSAASRETSPRLLILLRRFGPAVFAILGTLALIVVLVFVTTHPRPKTRANASTQAAAEPDPVQAPALAPLTTWSTDPSTSPPPAPVEAPPSVALDPAPLAAPPPAMDTPRPQRSDNPDRLGGTKRIRISRWVRPLASLRNPAQPGQQRRLQSLRVRRQGGIPLWGPGATFEPGEDLPPPGRALRPLDEGDPYTP